MASITRIVKYILKGDKGEKGASLRGPQAWSDCAVGYNFQAGKNGDAYQDLVMYGNNYYTCMRSHAKTTANFPTSTEDNNNGYWQLGDKVELIAAKIIMASYALVKNLGVETIDMRDSGGNIIFQAKDGNVIANTGTFKNIKVSGDIKAKSLRLSRATSVLTDGCFIDDSGTYIAPNLADGEVVKVNWARELTTRVNIQVTIQAENSNVYLQKGLVIDQNSSISFDINGSSGTIFGIGRGTTTKWIIFNN